MPNSWNGQGNPYTRNEVIEILHDTLSKGQAIIAHRRGSMGVGDAVVWLTQFEAPKRLSVRSKRSARTSFSSAMAARSTHPKMRRGFSTTPISLDLSGVSSLERMGVEESLSHLTRGFNSISLKKHS